MYGRYSFKHNRYNYIQLTCTYFVCVNIGLLRTYRMHIRQFYAKFDTIKMQWRNLFFKKKISTPLVVKI